MKPHFLSGLSRFSFRGPSAGLFLAFLFGELCFGSGRAWGQACCPDANSVVSTYAGTGVYGYTGDGGPAALAEFRGIWGMAIDSADNLYVCDYSNSVIRKITPGGIISTVAGTGTAGYSGDGGPATAAKLQGPAFVSVDGAGDLFISDSGNERIRKVDTAGVITTLAGNGTGGFSGDAGPAVNAELNAPQGVAVDAAGDVYIGDFGNSRIRKVSTAGIITTICGNGNFGYSGDGGPAALASIDNPENLVFDPAGNLVFNDDNNFRVRQISPAGTITTIVGTGVNSYTGDGGPATLCTYGDTHGFAYCAGHLYMSDQYFNRMRMIDSCGNIQTIAGSGARADTGDGGPALAAGLNNPQGIAIDSHGNLYVVEFNGDRIRKIAPDCSPTPTPACTQSPSPTPSFTPTVTPTSTFTSTPTVTPTPTWTMTPTATPTITSTPTPSPTPTPTCEMHVWPDPFNPVYAVFHTLKFGCLPPNSTVSIYTLSGEWVADAPGSGGQAQWNGRNQNGIEAAAGVYFYSVNSGGKAIQTGKFLLER